jgi:hypothetical protein
MVPRLHVVPEVKQNELYLHSPYVLVNWFKGTKISLGLISFRLTYVEQNPSSEADGLSAGREFTPPFTGPSMEPRCHKEQTNWLEILMMRPNISVLRFALSGANLHDCDSYSNEFNMDRT